MRILLLAPLCLAVAAVLSAGSEGIKELLDAVRKGDADTVRRLLDGQPALVDARGDDGVPAVRLAVYYRHPELVRAFIERGARMDIYDAAATGEWDKLKALLGRTPSLLNSRSTDGATPLALAAFFGHRNVVEYLLDRGAAVNTLSTNPAFPFTPLHSAMSGGNREIFDLILSRGADVRVREGGGLTVLHEAAAIGSIEYVRLLLAKGADPDVRTDEGKLPEDFAVARHHPDVAALLANARK